MTTTLDSTDLLKTEGRVPRERQEALLDEFERSGLSGAKFAALCGVKYPSFARWMRRRKRRDAVADGNGGSVQWLEAVVASGAPTSALMLHLPGGARMELTHGAQLPLAAQLLRLLTTAQNSAPALPC